MCYAALAIADLHRLLREYDAMTDVRQFELAFWDRVNRPERKLKFPTALDRYFMSRANETEAGIRSAIESYRAIKVPEWEKEIFEQRRRHADAERSLAQKPTKKAANDLRISQDKIDQRLRWKDELQRPDPLRNDQVVHAMNYAAVILEHENGRVVTPMRYHCRLAGKAAFLDVKLPGLYNARLDSLEGWWKPVFGRRHALFVISGFRENVKRHDLEHRTLAAGEEPQNVRLQFDPGDRAEMRVPCVWDRWTEGDEVLNSFALITDDPPPEVAQAGHDRCPINLTHEAALAWLKPEGKSAAELFEILAQRHRPYYEHVLLAA